MYMVNARTGQPTLMSSGHIDPRNITGFKEESEGEGENERERDSESASSDKGEGGREG